ncbi:hypothetical protein [Acinetobacter populi]|uniref:hypothetical protein n=1 Tax=Acinetobacter populi TaxID=1582270 RepID=UPI00148C8D59|nr:hypothetical protein [Acinetobacter populi]
MIKRLNDFEVADPKDRPSSKTVSVLPMQFGDGEATKRIVLQAAKRVIEKHKDELLALA